MSSSQLIDLSHAIAEGTETYPGLPAPKICDFISREASKKHYAAGTTFQIGEITMVANTGTYIDAPFHRFEDGIDISQLDLKQLVAVPALCFRAPPGQRSIGPELFGAEALAGMAVLVHTGWDSHWGTQKYGEQAPFLTRAAGEHLKHAGAVLVGIDSVNIDNMDDRERPVHTVLLGSGIPIVEHMCSLDQLPERGFSLTAVPAPIVGMGTFPVRAFATVPY